MQVKSSWARHCLAALLLGGLASLQAQDTGFGASFKMRMDATNQSKDNLRHTALGFGLNLEYKTNYGKLGAELGYFYKTGDPYLAPIGTLPAGAINKATSGVGAGQTLSEIAAADGSLGDFGNIPRDSRRNQLDGLTLRLSYQHKLTDSLDWQAGVMLGGTRYKHEWNASVMSANADLVEWGYISNDSWEDQYIGTSTEGGMKVSPYLGVTWNLNKVSSIEANVLFLNYTTRELHHIPGTADHGYHVFGWGWIYPSDPTDPSNGDPYGLSSYVNDFSHDYFTKQNRVVPHLEIAYVFHF